MKTTVAKNRQQIFKTGGGAAEIIELKDYERKLESYIQISLEGLPSQFDSDCTAGASQENIDNFNDTFGSVVVIAKCVEDPENLDTSFKDEMMMVRNELGEELEEMACKDTSLLSMKDKKDYAIVLFVMEKNAPGIILSKWIFNHGQQCFYPSVKTNEAKHNLLKKKTEPQEYWSSNSIKILNFYDTFAEARAHLRKAEDTSNLSSDDEGEQGVRQRKRIPARSRFLSTEEESEEGEEIPEKPLKFPKTSYPIPPVRPTLLNQHPLTTKTSRLPAAASTPSSTSRLPAAASAQESSPQGCYRALDSIDLLRSPPAASSRTGCVKQHRVNAELKEMVANMCTMLQRIEMKIDAIQEGRSLTAEHLDKECQAILMGLSASTSDEFQFLEDALKNNARFKKEFINKIASVCGR